jgi:transposase InsO family protein
MSIPRYLAEATFRYGLIAPLVDADMPVEAKRQWRDVVVARKHLDPFGKLRIISRRTLDRWVQRYRRNGFEGLQDKPRKDRGPRVLTEEMLKASEELLAENRRRNTEFLLKRLGQKFPKLKGKVGRSTLNRHLHQRGVSRRVSDVEAEPPPAFRPFEAPRPNALWHSDVHFGPVVITPEGELAKSRIIAWNDDFSRVCCHCEAYLSDDCNALLDCLRKAMRKYGISERTYTDNGSIYSGLQYALVCAELGITPLHTAVDSPWMNGKIERLWGVEEDQLFSEIKLLPPMPLARVNHYLKAWVEVEHHGRIHSVTGQRPLDRWHGNQPVLRHPTPVQEQRLFWLWERRKVTSTALVRLFNNNYAVDPALVNTWVIVRYDPEDLTRIQVWENRKCPVFRCDATADAPFVRRRENPPPPKDAFKPSPAAQQHLDDLDARYRDILAQQVGLTRFHIKEDNI